MSGLSILRTARAHLAEDPARLARGYVAVDEHGRGVSAIDIRARGWDVVGLILRAREAMGLGDDFADPGNVAMRAFRDGNAIEFGGVGAWSDAHDAHAILAAFDKAIALLEAGGAT